MGRKQDNKKRNPIVEEQISRVVYPQLKATQITEFVVSGKMISWRQIVLNETYICHVVQQSNILIAGINTALRAVICTHSPMVVDMAFFAKNVNLLASAGADGRIIVWKISEARDEEDKPQIVGTSVIALQIIEKIGDMMPRLCWHCDLQEILVVGYDKFVLRIDTNVVGKMDAHTVECPLQISVDNPVEGIQLVGEHKDEVSDLAMCVWTNTFFVSSSVDGGMKIWMDYNALPVADLKPFDGRAIIAVDFLTPPRNSNRDYILLVTVGSENGEVKLWVSMTKNGLMTAFSADSLHCIQTVKLYESHDKSVRLQPPVLVLSEVGLLLVANGRRDGFYAVHINYGLDLADSRIDHILEIDLGPTGILSLTGTTHIVHEETVAEIYCLELEAIKKYALYTCLCEPGDCVGVKSDSNANAATSYSEVIKDKTWKLMQNQILGLEKQMTTMTAKSEAAWARLEKNNADIEKKLQECSEKMLTMLTDFINKDMPVFLETVVTKEMASVSPDVALSLSPVIQKTCQPFLEKAVKKEMALLTPTVVDSLSPVIEISISSLFQKSLKFGLEGLLIPAIKKSSEDMVEQVIASIEKKMIEFISAAQAQYESNHSSLLPTLNETMEASVIPAVVMSMDASFREGIVEHTSAVRQQFESDRSNLSRTLDDAITSALVLDVQLKQELEMVEKQVFLSKELNGLILDCKFDEAFSFALGTEDTALVSLLCYQVDLQTILTLKPLPLSQNNLLLLLRMLSFELNKDTSRKLSWMLDVASAIIVDQTNASDISSVCEHVEFCITLLPSTPLSVRDKTLIRAVLHMISYFRGRGDGK